MANKRIKDLPAATETTVGDILPIDGATTRGITVENFLGDNLEAIKGLTSAANKGIQFTGAGTAAVYDLTTAGKALLDDADAAAQRTTLGLVIGTNVQAQDAGLQSISGLTTDADKMIYTTASDTYAVTDLTSFARTILDDADQATAQATLGLTPGTDVQTQDAGLQSIAGLTTAADKMIYTTASDTYAVTTLTTFARTILDDTDASTVRTTLGLAIGSNVQAYNARLADIAGITYAQGDILYHDGTNLVKLSKGTDGQFLKIGSTIPEWATLAGGGDMLAANNLSDVANTATARDNLGVEIGADVLAYDPYLHSNIPQNSKSAAYTTVLSDAQKHLFHPSADTTARTFTIDSNANVAYPVGTAITFINQNGGGVITISITSDTMRLAGAGTTGSRSLAANGIATAVKVATTEWLISGVGLS